MKKTIYFLFIVCLISGCQNQPTQILLTLQQVEKCMNEHPDSALQLLNTIPATTLRGKERAEYALLFTQACDKNYIMPTSDSLIQIAVDYYKNKKGELNCAKSYYYLGCVYRDLKQQKEAIEAWLKALRLIPEKSTDRVQMLLYNNLANAYSDQGLFEESMEMYQRAYSLSLGRKDTLNLFYSLKEIAQIYLMEDKADSSLIFNQRAIRIAQQHGNKRWEAIVLDDIAKTYLYRKNDSLTAYRYISASIAKDSSTSALILKSQLLLGMNKHDSARLCLLSCKDNNNMYSKTSRFHYLYLVERYAGNHNLAYAYNDSMQLYMDSIHSYNQYQKVKDLSLNYQLEMSKKELQMQKRIFYYVLAAILISIVLITFAFHQYKEKKRREKDLKQQTLQFDSHIEAINDYLKEHGSDALEITTTVNEHKKQKIQECISQFHQTEWSEKLSVLTPMQEARYITETEQTSLYEALDTIFPHFIGCLRKECPHIGKEDIYYCLLALIGYRTKTISYCTRVSTSALRTRKSRMKKNLSKETFELFFGTEE